MKSQWRASLCAFLAAWLVASPILAEQSTSDRAQLLRAILHYTQAEALAGTNPDGSLEQLQSASRELARCKAGNSISPEEIVILNARIVALKEQIKRRLQLTDQFFKALSDLYKAHRLQSLMRLFENSPLDLYLSQPRFLELRSNADGDYQKAFEYFQIGHGYFNRREFRSAKHWYEEGLELNKEYPKGTYYLDQARRYAEADSGSVGSRLLWGAAIGVVSGAVYVGVREYEKRKQQERKGQ
jgi:hypothetical protein